MNEQPTAFATANFANGANGGVLLGRDAAPSVSGGPPTLGLPNLATDFADGADLSTRWKTCGTGAGRLHGAPTPSSGGSDAKRFWESEKMNTRTLFREPDPMKPAGRSDETMS